jgi:hypothetical protein
MRGSSLTKPRKPLHPYCFLERNGHSGVVLASDGRDAKENFLNALLAAEINDSGRPDKRSGWTVQGDDLAKFRGSFDWPRQPPRSIAGGRIKGSVRKRDLLKNPRAQDSGPKENRPAFVARSCRNRVSTIHSGSPSFLMAPTSWLVNGAVEWIINFPEFRRMIVTLRPIFTPSAFRGYRRSQRFGARFCGRVVMILPLANPRV